MDARQGAFSVLFQMEREAVLPDLVLRQQQMEVEHSGHMWTHWNAVAKMCKECTVEKLKSCFDKNSWRGTRECHLKSAHLAGRLQLCYSRLATMRCSQARQPVGNVPPKSFRGTKNLSAALEEKSRKRVETKWNKYKEDILCGLVAPTGLLISAAF